MWKAPRFRRGLFLWAPSEAHMRLPSRPPIDSTGGRQGAGLLPPAWHGQVLRRLRLNRDNRPASLSDAGAPGQTAGRPRNSEGQNDLDAAGVESIASRAESSTIAACAGAASMTARISSVMVDIGPLFAVDLAVRGELVHHRAMAGSRSFMGMTWQCQPAQTGSGSMCQAVDRRHSSPGGSGR